MANERTRRTQQELDQAERWMREDASERRPLVWALAIALVLHAGILAARMPGWSDPVRMEKPEEELAMKVQFLQPPPPPPPPDAPPPEPPPPERKKIPRPDPKPDEPEPVVTPPPPPPEPPRDYVPVPVPAPPAPVAPAPPAPAPLPPAQMGPIRVSPGQGPGIIKKVEPIYPPMARTARMQGTVVLDAVIRKDGTVSNVSVVKSANAIFDRAAMDALKQWRFSPGQQDVIMSLTVHFKLD